MTKRAADKPIVDMTKLLLRDVTDSNDLECMTKLATPNLLPVNSKLVLPKWKPDEERAGRLGVVEREQRFVHQSLTQIDPMLIFSRDVIHQQKPPGPPGSSVPRY